ncbi:DgyrCDS40 [Dimorphilus gyrociliatus]|uniref:DgyrCDS40 n=1 Tax=Dimorphilus gyrociliatus TaxID=2664684 RepID=A0A7I8V7S9_9ANNE|nr:DgyrCDS40 [Dimorphilus gyrociliatus]
MKWYITFQLFLISENACQYALSKTISSKSCLTRNGYLKGSYYESHTCVDCFIFLFQNKFEARKQKNKLLLNFTTNSLIVNLRGKSDFSKVCSIIGNRDCSRLKSCCESAIKCCKTQTENRPEDKKGYCPSTWDGYGCWSATPPNSVATMPCPTFIDNSIPSLFAEKKCEANGSWYIDPKNKREWTNYTTCLNLSDKKTAIYISVAWNVASLVLLVPSVCLFTRYRQLRKQYRIRLHINLFLSFIITSTVYLIWDLGIVYRNLTSSTSNSIIRANSLACRCLNMLTRYSTSANYMWMLAEGTYLHQLIVRTFEPPESLGRYYLIAWGFPWLPITAYSLIRFLNANSSCWIQNLGWLEWIIYGPNLSALLLNTVFLVNILRILLTKLQSHPNEPNNFRRALKATLILIPLFGLQLMSVIYRPRSSSIVFKYYEWFSEFITNSQGFLVSLIFCICNGEVIGHVRKSLPTKNKKSKRDEPRSSTQFVTCTADDDRRKSSATSDRKYIQLRILRDNREN